MFQNSVKWITTLFSALSCARASACWQWAIWCDVVEAWAKIIVMLCKRLVLGFSLSEEHIIWEVLLVHGCMSVYIFYVRPSHLSRFTQLLSSWIYCCLNFAFKKLLCRSVVLHCEGFNIPNEILKRSLKRWVGQDFAVISGPAFMSLLSWSIIMVIITIIGLVIRIESRTIVV